MIRHNFYRSDGRLVKLFLFSTLLHKSPLTSIYFATFEKKREVRCPLPTQPNFLVFGKYNYIHKTIEKARREGSGRAGLLRAANPGGMREDTSPQ